MANSLNKLFVLVPSGTISGDTTEAKQAKLTAIENASKTNTTKIYFVQDLQEILVNGVYYGLNSTSAIEALKTTIGASTDAATADTIFGKIKALSAFSGKSLVTTVSASTSASDDKVATEKAVATAVEAAVTSSAVTIEKVTSGDNLSSGAVATYIISQGGTALTTKIDIPKDLVLTSGSVITLADGGKDGDTVVNASDAGKKYLKLVIANQDAPIYISVDDLVDTFDATSVVTKSAITTTNSKISIAAGTGIESALGTVAELADANTKAIESMDATSNTSDAVAGITVQVDQTDGKISKPVVSVTGGSVAENDASVVTGGTVYTAIKTKVEALKTTADVQALTQATDATSGDVTLTFKGVSETDGVIAQGSGTDTLVLKKVATTGKAADVTVAALTKTTNAELEWAATDSVDTALGKIATAVEANAKALADMDHSETTVAEATDNSDYLVVAGGKTTDTNDYAYTVKLTEAAVTAGNTEYTADGVVTSTVLETRLGDLWETYSASSSAKA